MSRIRSRNNQSTEQKFVSILREAKITGWRRHYPLSERPDLSFPKERIAVFIDGCFWHACPRCKGIPKTNRRFWKAKFERNIARAAEVNSSLRAKGWKVLRFWEHDL